MTIRSKQTPINFAAMGITASMIANAVQMAQTPTQLLGIRLLEKQFANEDANRLEAEVESRLHTLAHESTV